MTGTGPLLRLILRRDRFVAPLWTVILAVIPLSYLSTTATLFPDDASRAAYALGVQSDPAQRGLLGPVFGGSVGALTIWRSGIVLVLVGLASLLTVIRHTRTEEESGRQELVGAGVVGRAAPLVAALLFTTGADLVLGFIVFAGTAGQGYEPGSALAMGLAFTAVGWAFAGVGALAAQLAEGARTARGLALGVLGAAFLLRVVGDSTGRDGGSTWVSWLSPVGWSQQVRAFAGERWWVFALPVLTLAVLGGAALWVCLRRDLGAGVVATRPGPADAPPRLAGPFGLAWRQHWGTLLGWSIAFAVIGVVVGGASRSVGDELSKSQALVDLLRQLGGTEGVVEAYLASTLGVFGLLAAAYTISAVLRMRAEEEAQRTEAVLATSVSRLGYSGSHLAFAAIGPAMMLAVGGALTGLVYGAATGDVGGQTGRLLLAGLVQVPAVWVVTGLALALFGLLPRLTVAAWAVLAGTVLISFVAPVLRWDQWTLDLSPFTHVPRYPSQAITALPLVSLTAIAVVLSLLGLAGFRRRDIG
jgi:polyether ionophore transport system permease protein